MVCLEGFEPPTPGLEGRCSIRLSYKHMLELLNYATHLNGAEDGIRTRDPRLGKAMLYH